MKASAAICVGLLLFAACTDSTAPSQSPPRIAANVGSSGDDQLITIDLAGYTRGANGELINDPCSGETTVLTGSKTVVHWTPRGFTTSHVITSEKRKIDCPKTPYVGGSIALNTKTTNGEWQWLGSVAANVQRRGFIQNVPASANVQVVVNAEYGYELLNPGAWTEEHYPGSGIYVREMSAAQANGLLVGFQKKPSSGGPGGDGPACEEVQFICP